MYQLTIYDRHRLCEKGGMRPLAVALLATFVLIACNEESPTSPGSAIPIIVAFGDSLTAGPGLRSEETYPALLQQRLTREGYEHRVVNAGVSGDTTSDALARFDSALVPDTKIVILAIGGNDGLRRVPVATVERNIATMIERAQTRGIDVLLCQMEAPPLGGITYTIDFHRVYTRLSERYKVRLVPFFLIGIIGNDAFDLDDTLHPTAAGHRVIADTIWPHLRPML